MARPKKKKKKKTIIHPEISKARRDKFRQVFPNYKKVREFIDDPTERYILEKFFSIGKRLNTLSLSLIGKTFDPPLPPWRVKSLLQLAIARVNYYYEAIKDFDDDFEA